MFNSDPCPIPALYLALRRWRAVRARGCGCALQGGMPRASRRGAGVGHLPREGARRRRTRHGRRRGLRQASRHAAVLRLGEFCFI